MERNMFGHLSKQIDPKIITDSSLHTVACTSLIEQKSEMSENRILKKEVLTSRDCEMKNLKFGLTLQAGIVLWYT